MSSFNLFQSFKIDVGLGYFLGESVSWFGKFALHCLEHNVFTLNLRVFPRLSGGPKSYSIPEFGSFCRISGLSSCLLMRNIIT